MQSPRTDVSFICSFKNIPVHTSDKNGVMYARFEILAVLPSDSAIAHSVVAIAIVVSPCHKNPRYSKPVNENLLPFATFTTSVSKNVAKNDIITDTLLLYSNFLLSAVKSPYDIAAIIQRTAPRITPVSNFNKSPPVTTMTPINDSIIATAFLAVIFSLRIMHANTTLIIGHR